MPAVFAEKSPRLRVVFFRKTLRCKSAFLFRAAKSYTAIPGGMASKKMLEVNELNKKKLPAQAQKNRTMENTLDTRENALLMVATQVEDFDDLLKVQAETGLDMAELETMYYSII